LPLPILVFFIDWRDKLQRMGGAPVVLDAALDLRLLVQLIVVNYYRDLRIVWAVPTS